MNKLIAIVAIVIIVGVMAMTVFKKKLPCSCKMGHNGFMSCQCHSRTANDNLVFPHILTTELYKNPYTIKSYNMKDEIPGFYKLKTKFPKLIDRKYKKV